MFLELPPIEPGEQQPQWDYTIDLPKDDGTFNDSLRFLLEWCERTESWYLSIFGASDVLLLGRLRMVADFPLGYYHTGRVPTGGILVLLDVEGTGQECDYDGLGHGFRLTWITDAEIPEAEDEIPITIVKAAV